MATLSKKIKFTNAEKLEKINPETLKLWQKYKIDMALRELSPKSIEGYYNDLTHLWIYTYDNFDNISITELDEDQLTEFFYYCKSEGNNSRRIKRRMSSVAAFYKFLRKKKIILENPMEYIDRPAKDTDVIQQTFLSAEQVKLLFEKLNELVDNSQNVNDRHNALKQRCYAVLSLSTMARVNAVSSITWEQIDFESRTISDVLEKEGKIVTLYFSEYTKQLLLELRAFRENNNIEDWGFVLPGANGSHTTPGTLTAWCKKIGALIDVPTLHPHDFRHSGSQLMKLNGAAVEDISALLNHAGTDVTIKYYLRRDEKQVQHSKDEFGI